MQHCELIDYLSSNISNKDTLNKITEHLGSQISITERITCGYTNEVYKISIPTNLPAENQNTKHKILKLFKNHDRFIDEQISLALNFPPIDFTDNFIRVEAFIESSPVNLFQDRFLIIDCLRGFHNNKIVQSLKSLEGFYTFEQLCTNDMKKIHEKYKYQTISDILKKIYMGLPTIECEYVIHNDLVSGNILKTPENKIFLIDFEYSCIGSIELDLACLIEEMLTDYSFFDSKSKKLSNIPNDKNLEDIVAKYFNFKNKNDIKNKKEEIKKLQSNVQFYHLLWTLNNIKGANASMDYMKYALYKLDLLCINGFVDTDCYQSLRYWLKSL